jgi:undecaprenyl-diphosphatase
MDFVVLLKAAVMGIVEGLTEFLPISSTGHLILAGALLGLDDEKGKVFDIAIQTGAIFAVILVYWQKISRTVLDLPSDISARRFAANVVIAFLPAVVLGLLFGKQIKMYLFTPEVVASTFILGGLIILWVESQLNGSPSTELLQEGIGTTSDSSQSLNTSSTSATSATSTTSTTSEVRLVSRIESVDEMTAVDALKVGLVQCLAMIPGTSRSGATIIGGMVLGLSRKAATDFSFYLAIPTLIGAGAYSLYGLIFSFISAWVCVRWLLRYIASHSFVPFAWYRIVFGVAVWITAYTGLVVWG